MSANTVISSNIMRAAAAALCGLAAGSADVRAEPACDVPQELMRFDYSLPRVAQVLASDKPLVIVAIGSSSTRGFGVPENANYPSQLKEWLTREFHGHPITMINSGLGGDEMPKMLDRFDKDVFAYNPDLVIVQAGVNAVVKGMSLADVGNSLRVGVDQIRAMGADAALVDLQDVPQVIAKPEAAADMENIMASVAKEKNVNLFHRYDITQHWLTADHLDVRDFTIGDGLHMNGPGYACMVRGLGSAIAEAAQRPAPLTTVAAIFLGVP